MFTKKIFINRILTILSAKQQDNDLYISRYLRRALALTSMVIGVILYINIVCEERVVPWVSTPQARVRIFGFTRLGHSCSEKEWRIKSKVQRRICRVRPLIAWVRSKYQGYHCDWGSHCSSRTMEGSLLAPSMNSSSESFPSLFRSICRNILSVRFSGVDSSSGIFITEPTIL